MGSKVVPLNFERARDRDTRVVALQKSQGVAVGGEELQGECAKARRGRLLLLTG